MGKLGPIAAAAAVLSFTSPSPAHHSPAAYDLGREVTIEGTVVEYEWAQPHVYLTVGVESKTGERRVVSAEAYAPTTMRAEGWSRESFAHGDHVVITGRPPRNPARDIMLLTTARKLGEPAKQTVSSKRAEPQPAAESLAGTWETMLDPPVFLRFSQSGPLPLTARGAAAVDAYDDETMNPGVDCVPFTAPMYMVFPAFRKIEIGERTIFIRGEDSAVERVVYMDRASHDGAAASLQGHSIGRWEGDVLVVDTRRFLEHRLGNAAAVPSSTDKHLIERFELDPSGRGLLYRFELIDPVYLEEPVTGELHWVYRPDVAFSPHECNLKNARRFLEN